MVSLGIRSYSPWAINISHEPRRIRLSASLGRGFVACEPPAQRFRRAPFGSPFIRTNSVFCWQVRFKPVASERGTSALQSNLPPHACASGRLPPPNNITGGFGECPFLSWLFLAKAPEIDAALRIAALLHHTNRWIRGARLASLIGRMRVRVFDRSQVG